MLSLLATALGPAALDEGSSIFLVVFAFRAVGFSIKRFDEMEEIEENDALKRPSKSRRKRQLEKKLATEMDETEESGKDGVDWSAAAGREENQPPPEMASISAGESRKPKAGKKAAAAEDASEEPGTSAPKRRKKRRKKAAQPNEESLHPHTILRDLAHLGEDVVEEDGFVPGAATAPAWHTNVCVPPTGKLFVESRGAFKAVDKQKLMAASGGSSPAESSAKEAPTAAECGLRLRSVAGKVARCCHGLLAGFALWQCVTVYCLGPPRFPLSDFLVHYSPLASAVQALFYAMTAVCIVSLMGSINVGGEDGVLRQFRHVGSGLVALVLYFVTLLLSLSIADKDDALSLFAHNSSLPGGDEVEGEAGFGVWRNVNLCRCLGAVLAWLVLAFRPQRDLLKSFLRTFAKSGGVPDAALAAS